MATDVAAPPEVRRFPPSPGPRPPRDDRGRNRRLDKRIPFVAAVLAPGVATALAVLEVTRSVAKPEGWIWLSLALGTTATYVATQIAGTKLFRWNASDNAQPRSVVVRLAMEVVAMTERAADTGHVPAADTVEAARIAERLVSQWRRRNLSYEARTALVAEIPETDVQHIVRAHAALTPLVRPATPQSLRFAKYRRDNDVFPYLGQIQLVRQMMGVAVAGLVVLLVLIQKTDFSGTGSETVNIVVLLASSALGGAFYALSTANRFVKTRTFDPSTQPEYWTRFVLGLVSGGLLATVIPVTDANPTQDGLTAAAFAPPLLALLGGFSAEVVRQVLDRLVDTLQTVVTGRPTRDRADRAAADVGPGTPVGSGAGRADVDQRLALVRTVVGLERELGPQASDAARRAVAELWARLGFGPDTTTGAGGSTPP
ncbi:hypothetical protein ACXR2U_18405 [Jatrophihabitans sp. YIM 134969]